MEKGWQKVANKKKDRLNRFNDVLREKRKECKGKVYYISFIKNVCVYIYIYTFININIYIYIYIL